MQQNAAILIGNIAANLVKHSIKNPECLDTFSHWNDIVDAQISCLATPYKIIGKTPKTLVIKVKKGYALQIQHESMSILQTVNAYFHEQVFSQLRVIQMDEAK